MYRLTIEDMENFNGEVLINLGITNVKIKKLVDNAIIPFYSKDGDMGMDITCTSWEYDVNRDCYVYHTGLAFELPKGYGMLIFPRSSNRNTEAYMTNHVGVLDSGYRGELLICFKNRTSSYLHECINKLGYALSKLSKNNTDEYNYVEGARIDFDKIKAGCPYGCGDRVAQIVILPYPKINFVEVEELSESERGEGGHGSTGK